MAEESKFSKAQLWKKTRLAFHVISLTLASFVLSLAPFFFLYKYIPAMYVPFTDEQRIDHFVVFFGIMFIIYYLLMKIRRVLYILIATGFLAISITHFSDIYRYTDLFYNYKTFLFNLREGAIRFVFEKYEPEDFAYADDFRAAIDYRNPNVRSFAVNIAVRNFDDLNFRGNLRINVQCFSIFKEIRGRWRYVFDPNGEDYWAKASETIKLLKSDGKFKGDCDDYSILMVACIKAIGGEVRLVRTKLKDENGNELNHVYPEVRVGSEKDLEDLNYMIKQVLFPDENRGEPIYYHIDDYGGVWLNFDYNDYYPGGKYQSTIRVATLDI